MKQTAVRWLIEYCKLAKVKLPSKIKTQAKEMERQQKASEYLRGYHDAKNFKQIIENETKIS